MYMEDTSKIEKPGRLNRLKIAAWCHGVVLVLSVLLVVYISIDTFRTWNIYTDTGYMRFQLVVCCVFMADFFVEMWVSPDRRRFFVSNLIFLIVAIPYLNIIQLLKLDVPADAYYYLRFMPVLRGAYVMARSVGYLSHTRIVNIFWSYISLMAMALYFGTLMFYWREHAVNPAVISFWDSLFFCASQMTTLGCEIYPVSDAGRVISSLLSIMGMAMFPLFTVYMTAILKSMTTRRRNAVTQLQIEHEKEPGS